MLTWLKDWAPVVAPTLALLGVLVTVHSASQTYRRGQAETRKDRQRALIAQLIIDTRNLADSHSVFIPAAGKFNRYDLLEWLETDSGKRHGQLNAVVHEGAVKALCEISNPQLRPLILDLAARHRGMMEGKDAEPLHNDKLSDDVRFEAVLVVLRRSMELKRTCSELELTAIEVLPVEIELPTILTRLKRSPVRRHGSDSNPPKHY